MPINDTTLIVVSGADPTKACHFDASGITPGATRVVTLPDLDITLAAGGSTGTPADTVTEEITYDLGSDAGLATTYSRGDHTHGTPPPPEGATILSGGPVTDGYVLTAVGDGTCAWEEATGGGATAIDDLTDVDTATDPPVKDECLKWNGTNWVPAAYNYSFVFSIASFTDNQATSQLIGSGVWKADEALTFGATYSNGPPTSAEVQMSNNGAAYAKEGEMTAPLYTAGLNTEGDINYPAAKDQYLRFRLYCECGAENDTEYETAIYFYNYHFWGVITAAQRAAIDEALIESLSSELAASSSAPTYSKTINSGADQYICVAYPVTSCTALDDGEDYESDGTTNFLFNGIALAMELLVSDLHITNSAGYDEHYRVYAAHQANLGNHTLSCSTGTAAINPLYYGITEKTDTFLEADVEALANSEVTNDNTQVWDSVTTGVGEYMLFAFPKRLGTVAFWVGGFEGGFEAAETVSVTNVNGWTEDYYVWRSTNSNLGATVVETKAP